MFTSNPKKLCVLLLLGLSACGVAEVDSPGVLDGPSNPPMRSLESNVIVGPLDWKSVASLPANSPERARSKAVGLLSIGKSICTAWLASKDVLITNGHCISDPAKVEDARVSFNFEDGVESPDWYDCPTLIHSWGDGQDHGQGRDHNDTAALRCNSLNGTYPGEKYGYLKVSKTDVTRDEPIYVIHQNCERQADNKCSANAKRTKKYSPGKVLSLGGSDRFMTHDADTLGGSSGAPMLSRSSHEVVGMNRGDSGGVNTAVRGILLREFLKDPSL